MARRPWFLGMMMGLLLLSLVTGCGEGEQGDDGKVLVNFRADASVTEVTLTGVGINVSGSTPDPDTVYRTNGLSGRVDWQTAGLDYTTVVDIPAEDGKNGDDGIFGEGTLGGCDCPPLTKTKGDEGGDRRYTLLFIGTRLLRFSAGTDIAGQL